MSKTITLNEHIRAVVEDVLSQQDGLKKWRQKEHGCALAKAAQAFAEEWLENDGKLTITGKDGKPAEAPMSWKTFLARYKEHGFAGGNLSQFQQALDGLPAEDTCHVYRPKRGEAELDDYE